MGRGTAQKIQFCIISLSGSTKLCGTVLYREANIGVQDTPLGQKGPTLTDFAEMDDSAQEELVGLIFGESPPEGWKDLPEFQLYLSELGNCEEDLMF